MPRGALPAVIGDRRRPGLPGDLLARVALIWAGLGGLQLAVVALGGWIAPHLQLGALGLPALASLAALGCILLLVARLAFRVFDVETAGLACLACGVAVPLLAVLRPMTADPTAWQVVALLLALNGLMARDPRLGGWTIGGALGLGLALSLHGLFLTCAILALLAWRWLHDRVERDWLVHALTGLTAAIGTALSLRWAVPTVPVGAELSWPHLAASAWLASLVAVTGWREPHPRAWTIAGFAIAVMGTAVIVQGFAPFRTQVVPADMWSGPQILQAVGLPALALATTVRLFGQSRDWLRRWWGEYLVLLTVATALALADPRAAPAACALAALPLGWQVRSWLRAARNARRSSRKALALASMALAAAPALPLTLLASASPSLAGEPAP